MKLISPAFEDGGVIPSKYTCDGVDVSPPLAWRDIPANTKSFALICDDPDAPMGTWVHWVIYDIPVTKTELPEGLPCEKILADGSKQGLNDFGKYGYGGPCPPRGIHRYFFKLYALDAVLNLMPGLSKQELLNAIQGHILEETRLMGRYGR